MASVAAGSRICECRTTFVMLSVVFVSMTLLAQKIIIRFATMLAAYQKCSCTTFCNAPVHFQLLHSKAINLKETQRPRTSKPPYVTLKYGILSSEILDGFVHVYLCPVYGVLRIVANLRTLYLPLLLHCMCG